MPLSLSSEMVLFWTLLLNFEQIALLRMSFFFRFSFYKNELLLSLRGIPKISCARNSYNVHKNCNFPRHKIAAVNCFIMITDFRSARRSERERDRGRQWKRQRQTGKKKDNWSPQFHCNAFLFSEFHRLENLVNSLYLLICFWFKTFCIAKSCVPSQTQTYCGKL